MLIQLSDDLRREVEATIRSRITHSLILDVDAAVDEIRRRHAARDIGLEDVAASIARLAAQCGCAIEFGGRSRVTMHNQSD